ncbi:MAG TPA: ATP-binding protein [Streptosporangiaceae bacterium]
MLDSATIDGLKALRLDAMAAALAEQREQAGYTGLGFEERLGLLVDRELTARANRRLERHLKTARLRVPATVEDIDFRHPRGLDRAQILTLAQAHWVQHHRAVVITGPTGQRKTYLARAPAHAAIRNGHTALYQRAPRMLDDLAIARGDGRLARLLAAWARVSVLVIDDLLKGGGFAPAHLHRAAAPGPGDAPRQGRGRPLSVKADCDRRATADRQAAWHRYTPSPALSAEPPAAPGGRKAAGPGLPPPGTRRVR